MTAQSVAAYYRIRYQRVRCEDTRQQQRCHARIVKHINAQQISYHKRSGKRKQSEHRSLGGVLPQPHHIHLQSGKKHYVENAHSSKQFETAVVEQHIESVRAYKSARNNHSDEVRNAQAVKDYRRKQNDAQHDKEYPCRVCYWEIGYQSAHKFTNKYKIVAK